MTKQYFSFVLFIFLSASIIGQSAIYDSSVGADFTEIDSYLNENTANGVIPGGVFLVAKKGKIKFFKSYGFDDKSMNNPYQNDHIFRIASMTKSLTIVSILQLMEKGKLDLDDPLSKYIPAFKKTMVLDRFNESDSTYTSVKQKNEISIRNLLTHTSGIYYGGFETDSLRAVYMKNDLMSFGLSSDKWSTKEMVDKIAEAPLAFQPGSAWKYGLNMEVLGRIIEVISKTSLDDYFNQNILMPLGMKDTYFYLPKEKQGRMVKLHASDSVQKILEIPWINYPYMAANNHFAGGGGLSSTTLDYATFCMALANQGTLNKKRILKKKSVKLLSEIQFTDLDKDNKGFRSEVDEMGFGLGYWVLKKGNSNFSPLSEGSYGWGGVFNTKYYIDPKKDIVIVGMTQMMSFDNKSFWEELNKTIYKAID